MIIEYSNAKEPKNHARLSVAIVVASCAFFFIPTTLIVLGYLASQPTGTLISPLPQGILSQSTPTPSPVQELRTENLPVGRQGQDLSSPPLIAAGNDSTSSAQKNISQVARSNIIDKTASISANLTEVLIMDPDIKLASQIYLSPRLEDSSTYSVKSKAEGQMTVEVNRASDMVRYVDYHIVNP